MEPYISFSTNEDVFSAIIQKLSSNKEDLTFVRGTQHSILARSEGGVEVAHILVEVDDNRKVGVAPTKFWATYMTVYIQGSNHKKAYRFPNGDFNVAATSAPKYIASQM